jgi:hypothetical protein
LKDIKRPIQAHPLFIICFCCIAFAGRAQPGCTDPQATNFSNAATLNDGSCLYPVTSYAPQFRATLDGDLKEISGLHPANGEWWAHNDSGFDPEFFSINPETGAELKKIKLKNANNRDWEDVCSDGASLYFGDFGNNNNDRQNLGIYSVPFTAIGNSSNQSVNDDEYHFVSFAYPDQTDFTTQQEDSTVYDCEAMLFDHNQLQLFTKNRKAYTTTHYALDPVTGVIQAVETFDADGQITGASMAPDGKLIALVGYDLRGLPTVFCWLLWDWPTGTNHYFSGNKRRIELGSAFSIGQVESIAFDTNRSGYIANERTEYSGFLFAAQSTRAFDVSAWVPETVATQELGFSDSRLQIYPNPCGRILSLETSENQRANGTLEVFNQLGILVLRQQGLQRTIDLGNIENGVYHLRVLWPDGTMVHKKLIRS